MSESICGDCKHGASHHMFPGCEYPDERVVGPGIRVKTCGCPVFISDQSPLHREALSDLAGLFMDYHKDKDTWKLFNGVKRLVERLCRREGTRNDPENPDSE